MIKYLLILLLSLSLNSLAEECELFSIRSLYGKAVDSERFSENLIANLKKCEGNVMTDGYLGAAQMILAKHTWNPIRKSNLFFKGKNILEATILRNFEVVELRFLRLTIQFSSPNFLGYKSSIHPDKEFILANYFNLDDDDLRSRIKSFIINSGCFDQSEIKYILK